MNDQNQTLEIVEPSALEQMERASIDVQISTAKKYPRELSRVKQQMLSFATLDEETAASCFYTLKRKERDGTVKLIQGPSVRLAEIAIATYGHLRAGARIVGNDGKKITAQGVCHDLQNNSCICMETQRRITTSSGATFSEDMQIVAGNAAAAIALRNAVFKVVPMALIKPVFEAAKKLAIGDGKTLAQRRAASLEHFSKLGISKERVFAALEVSGIDDITLAHVEIMIGFANAIKDGEQSADEIFSETKPAAAKAGPSGGISAAAASTATPPPPAPVAEQPAAPATVPAPVLASAASPDERAAAIDVLKNKMLDHSVEESRLWKYAKDGKHVPEGVDELWALPTETLSKLALAVPALGKKGGAK